MKPTSKNKSTLTPAQIVHLQERALTLWCGERTVKDMTELENVMVQLRNEAPDVWQSVYSEIQLDIDLEGMQYE